MKAFKGNLDPHFPKKKRLCKKRFKVSSGVPEKKLRRATSGTRAIGSLPLDYGITCSVFFFLLTNKMCCSNLYHCAASISLDRFLVRYLNMPYTLRKNDILFLDLDIDRGNAFTSWKEV